MSKFLNEGDFFMCSGGIMPAKMKSTQVLTGKKSAVKFIRLTDVQTTSVADFVCKKLMILMAVAAVLFALLCAVTGGAALIAAAAIGGAVGAAAGALICGTQAAGARTWLMPKEKVFISGQKALTDKSYMECTAVGKEEIRLAPFIKNWWQAVAVGVTNFAGEMFKCIMVGAAAAGGIVLLSEGLGAFLSNAATNYLLTWTSWGGLGLRGGLGVMEGVQDKYVRGESTEDAVLSGLSSARSGLEEGTKHSFVNVATGQGKPEDFAGLLAWGAPIAPAEEGGLKPGETDAMGGSPWEGKPKAGKAFLDSDRMSRSELQEYKKGLQEQGVDFTIDKKSVLPDNARAGFDPNNGKVYLRKGATQYEAFHEAQHAKQWGELGKDAYLKQSRAQREQYVYDQIAKNKGKFSQAELDHAKDYINDVRAKEGLPPVLDAVEGGSPKKGADGDVFEDPTVAKKEAESAKPDDELNANVKGESEDVYHMKSDAYVQGVIDGIDPQYFQQTNRYSDGFYIAEKGETAISEVTYHGGDVAQSKIIRFELDKSQLNVLDLTDPKIANEWGLDNAKTFEQNVLKSGDPTLNKYEKFQEIADKARSENYNAIKFESARGAGSNYVIYGDSKAFFESVLKPQMVMPAGE